MPWELEEAFKLHRLGVTLTLTEYASSLTATARDDLLLIKQVERELMQKDSAS